MPEVRVDETERASLTNGLLAVDVHLNKGTYDIRAADARLPAITNAAASIDYFGGPSFSTRGEDLDFVGSMEAADVHGKGITVLLSREAGDAEPEVHLLITVYEDHPFAVVRTEIQNLAAIPARIQELRPMDSATINFDADGPFRFYKHGWQSWSPTVVLDTAGIDVVTAPPVIGPGTQPERRDGRFVSELVTAVVEPASDTGVVAGLSRTPTSSRTRGSTAPDVISRPPLTRTASSCARGILASEPLYIELTGDAVRSLTTYGDALTREMGRLRRPWSRAAGQLVLLLAGGDGAGDVANLAHRPRTGGASGRVRAALTTALRPRSGTG
jgi:hypothetical protein